MDSSSKIEVVSWSDDLAAILARAAAFTDEDDPGVDLAFYRALMENGKAGAVAAMDGDQMVGAAIYMVEPGAVGLEFVILACASTHARYGLVENHLSTLEYIATAMGAKSIRFHTRRGGLARKMAARGYRESETIFRKSIGRVAEPVRWECNAYQGITMGGGGGGSSSSQTNQTDERIAADSSVVADDGATINIDVQDITPELAKEVAGFADRVFDFAETERDATRQLQSQALDRAFDSTNAGVQDLLSNVIKLGAGAAAAYATLRYGPDFIKSLKG